ncbi:MAG: MFS transporter [Burkholderiaceae bacterium]
MTRHATPPPLPIDTIVALCVLNHVAMAGSRVALALHALRLGVPSLGLALMLAPYALTSALGALPIGRWVDRVGARMPALAGMAVTTLGLAVAAWQPGRAVLAVSATLVGLGYVASVIALQSELARERGGAGQADGFARFAIGTAASSGFGPFLAGQCMAHGGARVAFGTLALASLAACCSGAWNARRLQAIRPARVGVAIAPAPWFSPRTLAGLGGLRRLLLADLLMAFAWNANSFTIPLVGHRHGWSDDTVGNLLGCFGIAVMLVRALPSALRTRGGNWATITRALVVGGGVLMLLPVAATLPVPYALEALLGCGLGSSLPSMLALIEARTPAGRRAEALGLRQVVLGIGAATLPTTLGTLVCAIGLGAAVVGFGGALLACAVAIAPRRKRQRS